jgi:hypothetical protein
MGRDPDAKDCDVDQSDENGGAPLQSPNSGPLLRDDRDSVDDDLHEQLDLENPEKEDEE